jgi:hypothetical protein
MEFMFPAFADPRLEQFSFCCFVSTKDATDLDIPTEPIEKRATYESADGRTIFLGVFIGWLDNEGDPDDPRPLHVHLEFAAASFFDDDLPEVNGQIGEIRPLLTPFLAKSIWTNLDSRFVVALKDVPRSSIVHPLLAIEVKTPQQNLSLTGSRFDIGPPPIRRLTWFITNQDGEQRIVLDVVGQKSGKLSKASLTDAVDHLKTAFDAVIVPGSVHHLKPEESRNVDV